MKLKLGSRVLQPAWYSVLLTMLLVPALMSLGFWQLQRAQEKRDLMAQAEQGRAQLLDYQLDGTQPRYQQVRVSGEFDNAHQILLDNMPSAQGQPGYRVWTPLHLANGNWLLVDRGWIAGGADRQQLPTIDVSTDSRTVSGLLDTWLRPGVRAGDAGITAKQWPQRLNYPTYAELQALYGGRLQPQLVLMDAALPDGYERQWQIDVGFTPARHVGYAIQWFGLALTLFIIFIVVNLRRLPHASSHD